ncbi:rcc01693 family protein [Hoeflea olei]|uniref:Phage tail assembly chaperone n=1 Tax=Hoeflea olei TaxID=1480615 RepID=A0A1C1YQX3_9HYPH|nr:rcc01693 family protein [Hoeflea olei]OCW55770.1 hypothetical protein AWJ14_14905 [Hoeflea olei]
MTETERTFFPWASVLRFGLGRLRLNPESFWRLTLVELAALLDAGAAPAMTTRQTLETLMRRFPDRVNRDLSKEPHDG